VSREMVVAVLVTEDMMVVVEYIDGDGNDYDDDGGGGGNDILSSFTFLPSQQLSWFSDEYRFH
jgi:hypothetical protein